MMMQIKYQSIRAVPGGSRRKNNRIFIQFSHDQMLGASVPASFSRLSRTFVAFHQYYSRSSSVPLNLLGIHNPSRCCGFINRRLLLHHAKIINFASFSLYPMTGNDPEISNTQHKEPVQKSKYAQEGDRSDDPARVEILEKGEIFFFYRPKVEREHPASMDDVQRMYMVIKPEEAGKKREMVKQAHESGKEGEKMANSSDGKSTNENANEEEAESGGNSVKRDDDKRKMEKKKKKSANEGEERQEGSHGDTNDAEKTMKKNGDTNDAEKLKKKNGDTNDAEKKMKKNGDTNDAEKMKSKSHGTAEDTSSGGRERGRGEETVKIETQPLFRFIILGRKSLPDASKKRSRPYWGFVELVTTKLEDIRKALGPEEYSTATRGERHIPAARPAGEGRFCIVKHRKGRGNQSHTHLAYKLELPKMEKSDSPQSELHIEEEGSYIIQVKNPNQAAPPNVGLGNKRKATYPAHLQSAMGYYRFIPLDPCDFLNFEGCEFILISASDDLEKELGLQLDAQHDESCSVLLNLCGENRDKEYVRPLLEGEWA